MISHVIIIILSEESLSLSWYPPMLMMMRWESWWSFSAVDGDRQKWKSFGLGILTSSSPLALGKDLSLSLPLSFQLHQPQDVLLLFCLGKICSFLWTPLKKGNFLKCLYFYCYLREEKKREGNRKTIFTKIWRTIWTSDPSPDDGVLMIMMTMLKIVIYFMSCITSHSHLPPDILFPLTHETSE